MFLAKKDRLKVLQQIEEKADRYNDLIHDKYGKELSTKNVAILVYQIRNADNQVEVYGELEELRIGSERVIVFRLAVIDNKPRVTLTVINPEVLYDRLIEFRSKLVTPRRMKELQHLFAWLEQEEKSAL
jgi:hypothetical protein